MLKSLELFGFKSFADRTRFDFSTGITCVVGPNGSGKSNVVDAMKWILGDQSAKSLRGKEMTDVIFNGSSSRKASAFAEATITFDNSTGWLPSDNQEVHIGRRIWRNGDAEYLLNRTPARLKDIKDLFLGTGAGSAAYSIIEQGRVDQILQANPASRRAVFEEAAGISRFRARKVEAQRKLERVAQNLERLTDIVDEVEAQLNSTRNQAAKAAKYREVSVSLKEWWFGLAADDHRHLTTEIETIRNDLASSEGRLTELTELQQGLEAREAAFDADLATLDDALRDVERRSASGREAVAGAEATIQSQTARLQELDAEITRLEKQQLVLGRRAAEAHAEIVLHQQRLADCEVEYTDSRTRTAERESRWQQAVQSLSTRKAQLEQDRARRLELTKAESTTAHVLATLEAQITSLSSLQTKCHSQIDQLDGTIAERELEREAGLARVDEAMQNHSASVQALRAAQSRRTSLLGEQEQTKTLLAENRERRSAGLARKSLLEDLELRQDGLGLGVKDILARAKSSPHPPWNTIVGSVADLLDVDLDHAALLEVALGPRAQLVVLREYQSLLDYLNQGTVLLTNRVGFLAIPDRTVSQPIPDIQDGSRFIHMQPDEASLPDLMGQPGVVMRADKLVLSDRGTTGLAAAVLADTWIVETMDDAVRLTREFRRQSSKDEDRSEVKPSQGSSDSSRRALDATCPLRFVTLQGELLESNGSLYAGTIRSETALLSRRSELRRLKNDLALLDRDIASHEFTLQTTYQSLTGADSELESLAAEVDYAQQRLADLKADVIGLDTTLDRLRRERQSLTEQLHAARQDREQQEAELAATRAAVAATAAELLQLEQTFANSTEELQIAEHEVQSLEQSRTADQVDLVKQAERLESLRTQWTRWAEELQQREAQHEEAERRYQAATTKRRQISLHILNTRATRDESLHAAELILSESSGWLARKQALRAERGTIVERELEIRKERRDLADRRHTQEMRIREIEQQLTNVRERLDEEYQIKLEDVVTTQASAWKMLLEERKTSKRKGRSAPKHRETDSSAEDDTESDDSASPDEATVEATVESSSSGAEVSQSDEHDHDEVTVSVASHGCEFDPTEASSHSGNQMTYQEARPEIESRVNRLRRQLKLMGAVNTDSLRDLEMLEERFKQMSAQLQDLVEAKNTLEDIIRKTNTESRRLFIETFETIRKNFQHLFRQVFGGGEGDIVLEDPNDVLDCGIDIAARPPGKELRSISLLSGGEKTMTAIAMIMAIFQSKPSPFCILDEVDAALDEANVERFTAVVKAFQQSTQFIMITHHKRSMTVADVMYGVTMEESGISKRMSVRFEDVSDDGHIRTPAQPAAA